MVDRAVVPKAVDSGEELIESLWGANPGLITLLLLAESLWVMEDVYNASRDRLAEIIEAQLQAGRWWLNPPNRPGER